VDVLDSIRGDATPSDTGWAAYRRSPFYRRQMAELSADLFKSCVSLALPILPSFPFAARQKNADLVRSAQGASGSMATGTSGLRPRDKFRRSRFATDQSRPISHVSRISPIRVIYENRPNAPGLLTATGGPVT
jgi:hypothetical protein